MSEVLKYIVFYTVFLGVLYFLQIESNTSIINDTPTNDYLAIFNTTTSYGWLNILLLVPAIVGGSYIAICLIRGVSP